MDIHMYRLDIHMCMCMYIVALHNRWSQLAVLSVHVNTTYRIASGEYSIKRGSGIRGVTFDPTRRAYLHAVLQSVHVLSLRTQQLRQHKPAKKKRGDEGGHMTVT